MKGMINGPITADSPFLGKPMSNIVAPSRKVGGDGLPRLQGRLGATPVSTKADIAGGDKDAPFRGRK